VLLLILMDESMRENGIQIKDMDMDLKNLVMAILIKGSIIRERLMGKERWSGVKLESFMTDNGFRGSNKDMAFGEELLGLKDKNLMNILANGIRINHKAMANILGVLIMTFMKVNGNIV